MDAVANFSYSLVATAPSPASSGLTLHVEAGTGVRFPDPPPFNAVVWPRGEIALPENAEIVRVTNVTVDTLTILRAQEGTTARSILVGDQIAAMITAQTLAGLAGAPTVRKFPFAFDTPDILTGAALYTPTIGDVLLDAWIQVDTAWDGTTPLCDVGTFGSTNFGLYANAAGAVVSLSDADLASGWGDGVLVGGQESSLSLVNAIGDEIDLALGFNVFWHAGDPNGVVTSPKAGDICFDFGAPQIWRATTFGGTVWDAMPDGFQILMSARPQNYPNYSLDDGLRTVPLLFTGADPVKVCVTQTGQNDGADPGSTQGSAVLYLVTATPV